MKNISKNTTGNTIYPLYLGRYLNAQRALEVHGKYYTTESCIFDSQYIYSAPNLSSNSFSAKSIFSFLVQKNIPINVESHMYKVPN